MPARLKQFVKAAEKFGFSLDQNQGKHNYKLRKAGAHRPYTVPAHNGLKTEIGDHYLKSFCSEFGIDFDEFKKEL